MIGKYLKGRGGTMKTIFRVGFLILAGGFAAYAPAFAAAPETALEGEWRVEQANSNGTAAAEGTLAFTRERGALAGTMRIGADELPIFEPKETGTNVAFTVVIPGTPYITVHYVGARTGDELRLVSPEEGHGVYTLTAHRVGAPAPQAAPPAIALAPPPSQVQTASLQAPPVSPPSPPALPPAQPATSAGQLEGNWTAQQQSPGSAAPIEATLVFTGNRGAMHVGADDWALFDVKEGGGTASFTLVIPGAPYVAVHYSGTISGNELSLASIDPDQTAFRLTARRPGAGAAPAPAPRPTAAAPPAVALLNPPPPAPSPQPPRVTPAPRVEAPPPVAAGQGAPPPKLALPALRDLPPNNLARTPPMGWASRQKLGVMIDDDTIRQAAEGLDETGLRNAGYTYVEVDDGWQGARDANGTMRGNQSFPDMKALVDYVHTKRLKFGLQISAGPKSCGGFEGSYGHEAEDARTFAAWGVDYVVYDWCGAESIYATQAEQQAAYQKMAEALRASGRDIVFGVSQNGAFDVAQWAGKAGANIWRTSRDLEDNWQSVTQAGFGENGKEAFAAPGRWNDPGLLQVGNGGMTADENRTQLNLWAVLAAPMMLGNDVRIMTRETLGLLINEEVIAVDQDPLGRQGKRVAQNGSSEVWARPLADGSMAVGFFNRGDQSAPVAVSWAQLGIEGPRARARSVVASGYRHGEFALCGVPDAAHVAAAQDEPVSAIILDCRRASPGRRNPLSEPDRRRT